MKPEPGTFLHETRRSAKWIVYTLAAVWLVFIVAIFA